MKKIAVVTGTRAEYGLLFPVMQELQQDPEFEMQLIVTGAHLSPEFGLTYRTIEADGFQITEKVEMLLSSDTPLGVAKSIGLGVIGFAETLTRLHPDLLLVLGDRFEILAAVQAALILQIPVAHIAGGDTTEGAFDESIRHCITKMSHLHFVTNQVAASRVRQLGEDPQRIFNVGSPGIDYLERTKLLDRSQLEQELDFTLLPQNLLITFHPVTLDQQPAEEQFGELLKALESFGPGMGLIFTKPNSDPASRGLSQMLDQFVASRKNARAFTSLGQLRYLSLMATVNAVVGNSSSGLYEAPSLKKPTVNIGDRQKGRLQALSVINCPPKAELIIKAIEAALVLDCSTVVNPYGDGHSSSQIIRVIKSIPDYRSLLQKHFHEVSYDD